MIEFFPASLSAFEHYLLLDSRLSFPLDFFVHAEIDGELSAPNIAAAFTTALEQHPLLNATIVKRRGRSAWNKADQQPTAQFVERQTSGPPFTKTPIDLRTEAGVRLSVIHSPKCSELIFQFHHATTDGLGAFGFVSDVLKIYARRCGDSIAEPVRDTAKLAQRHWCGYHAGSTWQKISKTFHGIMQTRKFLGAKIGSLIKHQPDLTLPRTSVDYPRHVSHDFTMEETDTLASVAKEHNVSLNTLLIGRAFQAFDGVRCQSPAYDAEECLRIAIPGNLRSSRSNDGFPAANFFSMTFPLRRTADLQCTETLMQSLQEQIKAARDNYYFATFFLILKTLSFVPGALSRMVNVDECQATLLLTNLGNALTEFSREDSTAPIVAGDVTVRRVELVPPMRPYQTVAIATLQYCGRQTVTLSYDPRIHSDEEAATMLSGYVSQLHSSIAPNS